MTVFSRAILVLPLLLTGSQSARSVAQPPPVLAPVIDSYSAKNVPQAPPQNGTHSRRNHYERNLG